MSWSLLAKSPVSPWSSCGCVPVAPRTRAHPVASAAGNCLQSTRLWATYRPLLDRENRGWVWTMPMATSQKMTTETWITKPTRTL
ncbi:hypothetical protein BCR44DRAFT_1426970 [Catenaria anguillulae PL171]|uniref:Uncharacterized protein n=1 Tax=Catenaria anguillulae PL171 TaxID=765915 RepID=A0A1Y2I118_9FUNG|nr:hypothetical protein BCR44DRAFT_1426970 [Catenaria anguillulae PL171]